jgi:2-amino-4-hydroxy-6-hydroxymethyldihydropteridine diphosphokinase
LTKHKEADRINGVYLGIGGNKGRRELLLSKAIVLIEQKIGRLVVQSNIYETAAWGHTKQRNFLNQVLFIHSALSPNECIKECLEIEASLGRTRHQKWESRTMDIDILFYNSEIIESKDLIIPHPHLHERNFILAPFCEIAPHFIHPSFGKKMATLLKESPDPLNVEIFRPKIK